MREPENHKSLSSYHNSPAEASQILSEINSATTPKSASSPNSTVDKAAIARRNAIARTARRNRALSLFTLVELLMLLGLRRADGTACPYCNGIDTLTLENEKTEFRCTSCKRKGGKLHLVKRVKSLSDWAAIAFLEKLARTCLNHDAADLHDSQDEEEPQSSSSVNQLISGSDIPQPAPSQEPQALPAEPAHSESPSCSSLNHKNHSSDHPHRQIFTASDIDRIKRETDLVRLVEEAGVTLKKVGQSYSGRCPFHNDEKTPSLSVTPGKNVWHCFSCRRGGSVLDWVMESRRVNFYEAMQILAAERPGLAFFAPPVAAEPVRGAVVLVSSPEHQEWMKKVLAHYHATLRNCPPALAYLEKRGLKHDEAIAKFHLGFCDRSLHKILPSSRSKEGERVRQMLQAIGIYNDKGYEHFSGCLVTPIFSTDGKIVGAYGRRIAENRRLPKHLYLPGPHAGLFNPDCLKSKEIVLCEAIFDAMSLWVSGVQNVTSSYGTNGLTSEQLRLFQEAGVAKVFLAYDSDQAGREGAKLSAERLSHQLVKALRIDFPDGLDANDFLRTHGSETGREFARLVEQAVLIPGNSEFPLSAVFPKKETVEKENCSTSPVAPTSPLPLEKTTEKENCSTPLPLTLPIRQRKDLVEIDSEDRGYRLTGVEKNTSYDIFKITLRVTRGDKFYLDNLDLYHARQRAGFIQSAAQEIGVAPEVLKKDLGRILFTIEQYQDRKIQGVLKSEKPPVTMTERERAEAMEFLRSPDMMQRIVSDFKICGLIGEETNSLICYLAVLSRKLGNPLALIIQSLSAAGKTALMDATIIFCPPEEVVQFTSVSGQSLFYFTDKDLSHKVLAISEQQGAEKATYAIKILQSEKYLKIASTGKDPKTGKMVTHEYTVEGPVMLMFTTTSEEIDEELLNRCLLVTSNITREQTRAILERQRLKETLEGQLLEEECDRIIRIHRNAQRLLRPIMVVNPYAEQLTFLDSKLRLRRDHVKYLTLIKVIAFLHQYQREVKKAIRNGKVYEYIEVTPADIALANRLAGDVLGTSLDELPPQTRKLLELIHAMVKSKDGKEENPQSENNFTRRQVREFTGWSNTQVRIHLDRLREMEYVLLQHGGSRGQQCNYELCYQGEGTDGKRFMMGLLDASTLRHDHKNCREDHKLAGVKSDFTGQKGRLTDPLRVQNGPETGPKRGSQWPSTPDKSDFSSEMIEKAENHISGSVGEV